MCGIVGYIGFNQASDFLLDGMAKLEYRGYDSAGIAVIGPENVIKIQKKVGRLANIVVSTIVSMILLPIMYPFFP